MSGDGTLINEFRATDPAAATAGDYKLYAKSDGYYQISEAGLVEKLGGAAHIHDYSVGSESTSGTTPITKASIVIPAEDATWIVEASALISCSNTTVNSSMRLQNTTDAVTLGRDWVSEKQDALNVLSSVIRVEFANTLAAGAKTLALQYFLESGTGTMFITDALITARKVA